MTFSQIDIHHQGLANTQLKIQSHRPLELVEAVKSWVRGNTTSDQDQLRAKIMKKKEEFNTLVATGYHGTEDALDALKELAPLVNVRWFKGGLEGVDIAWSEGLHRWIRRGRLHTPQPIARLRRA